MISIEVQIDASDFKAAAARLRELGQDATPIMRRCAGILEAAAEDAFDDEADPVTGAKWKPLAPSTAVARAAAGHAGKILQLTGSLAASLTRDYGRTYAVVGTNKEYAAAHQFGAVTRPHIIRPVHKKALKIPGTGLTEEGVYILFMLAQTPNAREFRSRVAAMLRELRSSRLQHQLSLATESAWRQGYDAGRASALPDVLTAERKARAKTARLLWPFGPVQKRQARRAARYRSMGLSQREIGRLLEIPLRSVQRILKAADALELFDAKSPVLCQGSLLELAAARSNGSMKADGSREPWRALSKASGQTELASACICPAQPNGQRSM